MNRKELAQDTLRYIQQGYYEWNGQKVDFSALQQYSEDNSILIAPEQGMELVKSCKLPPNGTQAQQRAANEATVKAILDAAQAGIRGVGVLNFASAKNPGGGFLNGAMAQEESLAASSGLYGTQLRNEAYYAANRACRSMMYTDYAIYSPNVVFFRNERFQLLEQPVTASVLTLPAVNYGQVLLKGEDSEKAKRVMKDRMRMALAIFADRGDKYLVLGAYGCGVFRNNPVDVAQWWKQLLEVEGYGTLFDEIVFAVLDSSRSGSCIRAFEGVFRPVKLRNIINNG
ncbi:TIGR02452 family protein [Paenibacillus sp. MER TA 81-3]|uniref:TIGR02452 family protein n=1 Tax=Paenibacillus sp. MER TA 81-3 TaxID=2939573 RepID=UPI002041C417|nr:TIGR02452 family protein [Paenibacillus sp. MER TA 81-3]MCM3340948.1 TIGR02452 family protein [Paenibacillus sp. MER TA 81-3]